MKSCALFLAIQPLFARRIGLRKTLEKPRFTSRHVDALTRKVIENSGFSRDSATR